MAEQCAATNLKPLYVSGEAPAFYAWTAAVGFAKGKGRLRKGGLGQGDLGGAPATQCNL